METDQSNLQSKVSIYIPFGPICSKTQVWALQLWSDQMLAMNEIWPTAAWFLVSSEKPRHVH